MKEIVQFLTGAITEGKRILVLCHPNADPDAIGSVLALADALEQLDARVRAGACGGVSRLSKNVLEAIKREIDTRPSLDTDVVVLVDTSSLGQLGDLGEEIKQKSLDLVVMDHHRSAEDMGQIAKLSFVKEDSPSAAELIFSLIRELGANLTPEMASLLLIGIVADTGQFRFATPSTFEVVNALIKAGASYERAMGALKLPEDVSKRTAMLKAAQRSELRRIHGRLVVFSEVGSFEADAATMLVRIGADAALVGSEEKGKVRLSARVREEVLDQTRLHLGDLMSELAKKFGGTGGGHAGAASMGCKGKLEEVKKKSLSILQRMLEPKERIKD
jgi:nanoRNase/pAp phosphatase (c-di-AMP/oligoRNAs hydrolase)